MDHRRSFDRVVGRFFAKALGAALSGGPDRRLSFAAMRRLLASPLFQARQSRRRRAAEARGLVVPPILIASVTKACNLDCAGCYSKALGPGAGPELGEERFARLFEEAVELGVGAILLAGGEPLLRRSLLERAAELPGILAAVFTNGTLVDRDFARLAARSSLVPVLSIEGEAASTAARRGAGVHEGALAAMGLLRGEGAAFGASITVTSRNADLVLSRDFLAGLGRLGVAVLFLIEYVPVSPGTVDLVIREEQRGRLLEPKGFAGLPFPVVRLPGDEEAFGGCLAAGRGFLHVAADGSLEACPFAAYSDTNLAARSFADALGSPLMKAIRDRHGELTETRGGCALWNRGGWVAELSACAGTQRGGGTRRAAAGREEPAFSAAAG